MANSVYDERRLRAWKVLYRTTLNDCYWKEIIAKTERRKLAITLLIVGVGLVGGLAIYFIGEPWYTAVATAIVTAVGALLNGAREWSDSKEPRRILAQWSDVYYDAERLWEDGEFSDWRKRGLEVRLVALEEREKSTDSREVLKQNDALVRACQKRINNRFLKQETSDVGRQVTETVSTPEGTPRRVFTQAERRNPGNQENRTGTERATG